MYTIRQLAEIVHQPSVYEDKYTRSLLQDAITDHVPLLSRKRVNELLTHLQVDIRTKIAIVVVTQGDPLEIESLAKVAVRNPRQIYNQIAEILG